MFKGLIYKDLYKSRISQTLFMKNLRFCFSELEKYDPNQQKKIIPLLIEDPFMPYGCNLRYLKNDYLLKFLNFTKEKQINSIAAFYHDKKRNQILSHGVECNINFYDASGEIVITSINADKRVKLINPIDPSNFAVGEPAASEVLDIRDNESVQKILNYEICKNIVTDINKVLYSFFEISSKHNSIDNAILREIHGNVNILIQNLLKQNMDFINEISKPGFREQGFSINKEHNLHSDIIKEDILNALNSVSSTLNNKAASTNNSTIRSSKASSTTSQKKFDITETYPEGISKLNKLIFKGLHDFLKLSKNFKKVSPIADIEQILSCDDPVLRTKLFIEMVYNLGDYVLKDLHMYEEYKKDSQQKHEKFFYRFAKKYVETVAGTENYDDYKKKLDEWEANKVISEPIKRAIELELKQAFATTGNDLELEDKKKTAIVEEIFSFPWDKRDRIEFDTKHTREVFNTNLYGMESVKERIFEYIAKLKRTHKNSKKGFVILISGPPGVGKTTVAQLIGQALKRKTGLINLAGENDTIKLKGSRRTYVDSQPSVFFKELVKLGVKNPVIILDEIDKISGNELKGHGAASTLLELLNPEENHNFTDLHLNIPLDFSETIFICTANNTMNMLEPLLDRIEIINIDEYTFREKKQISDKFLVPRCLREYGLDKESSEQTVCFTHEIMEKLIKEYSYYRSGIRGIKKNLEKIIRKANNYLLENKDIKELVINDEYLKKFLGNAKLLDENYTNLLKNYNEAGSCLTADITGQLVRIIIKEKINPVLKINEVDSISSDAIFKNLNQMANMDKPVEESLQTALELAREKLVDIFNETSLKNSAESRKQLLKEFNMYFTHPYHKKKGNSYGLALLIAFVSAGLNKKIDHANYLIAGELSPHGNVLRINGLKSLLNICEFFDIKHLILPEGNKADYLKFIENNDKAFNVIFVKTVDEALKFFFRDTYDVIQKNHQGNMDILLTSENYMNNIKNFNI